MRPFWRRRPATGRDDPVLGTGVPANLQARDGDWNLAELGIKMRPAARSMPWFAAAIVVLTLLAAAGLFFSFWPEYWPWPRTGRTAVGELRIGATRIGSVGLPEPEPPVKVGELLTLFVAGIGLAVGYQQWRSARKEASLEKYYERLDVSNRRMEAIWEAGSRGGGTPYHEGSLPIQSQQDIVRCGLPPAAMWVYTEIDNLEYVLQKYELGYVDKELMKRALGFFASLCRQVPLFAATARAGANPSSGSGYRRKTKQVVKAVTDAIDKEKRQPRTAACPCGGRATARSEATPAEGRGGAGGAPRSVGS